MSEPAQSTISPPTTESKLRGVKGWLLFFVISLTFLHPAMHVYIFYSEWSMYELAPNPTFRTFLLIDGSIRAALLILGLYAGVEMWRVKLGAVRVAKIYLGAIVVQQFILLLSFSSMMSRIHADPKELADAAIECIRPLAYVVIWYSYLHNSRRVASTYTS
jgi:hypothetical protein